MSTTNVFVECKELLQPTRIWQGYEVVDGNAAVPKESGIYAWYFRNFPIDIPTTNCITRYGLTLLYVGIAPSRLSSTATLHSRIRMHLTGNASGSTLRLTLGCLLSSQLDIQLRRVSDKRLTFSTGETKLSKWMEENAFVVWLRKPEPWTIEQRLIKRISLPLNLEHNKQHPFYSTLSNERASAKKAARELPIVGSS